METEDIITCPYCKHPHDDIHQYLDVGDLGGNFDMDCEECGESFNVDFHSVFYFTTTKETE